MDGPSFTDFVWLYCWTLQTQRVRFFMIRAFLRKLLSHIYTLKPGRYTVVLASAPKEAQEKATRFVFRCMAENVQVSHKNE